MCWQCDNPNGTTEEYLDELRETIRINGWAVQGVEDDRRPYAYTIGLHDRGLPELLVTGLSPERAARVLNDVAGATVGGRVLDAGCAHRCRRRAAARDRRGGASRCAHEFRRGARRSGRSGAAVGVGR